MLMSYLKRRRPHSKLTRSLLLLLSDSEVRFDCSSVLLLLLLQLLFDLYYSKLLLMMLLQEVMTLVVDDDDECPVDQSGAGPRRMSKIFFLLCCGRQWVDFAAAGVAVVSL